MASFDRMLHKSPLLKMPGGKEKPPIPIAEWRQKITIKAPSAGIIRIRLAGRDGITLSQPAAQAPRMQLFLFRISSCADLVKGKRKKCNQLLQKWAKSRNTAKN